MQWRLGVLSSGQLQRVLLAMAMMGVPDVVLVDEPTASLDEGSEEHVFQLLETIGTARNMLRQDVLESSFGTPLRFHSHSLENKP
jgi:ABC-type Mn2+/Zn2+ transport system ATPase subunit